MVTITTIKAKKEEMAERGKGKGGNGKAKPEDGELEKGQGNARLEEVSRMALCRNAPIVTTPNRYRP